VKLIDPDFTRVTFKINVSGSWANLVTCDSGRIDEVKAACEIIAKAGNGAKFKILDAAGGEIESYGYNKNGSGFCRWRLSARAKERGASA
jgi:hypothetical protein